MSGVIFRAPARTDRLHGFDAVRGLAAVAVVALHAAYPYIYYEMPGLIWAVPVDEPSRLADVVFWWTEASVMPLFFTLSGYFLARSLRRQSPGDVVSGRSRRLLLPMATVGLAVLTIDLQVWAFGLISSGRATFSQYLRFKYSPGIHDHMWGPAHLWYIQYLWILCAIVCGAVWLGRFARRRFDLNVPRWGMRAAVGCSLATLAAALVTVLSLSPEVVLGFQHSWLPAPAKFAHSAIFLSFGMLFATTEALPEWTRKAAPLSLLIAAGIFVAMVPQVHQTLAEGRSGEVNLTLGVLLAAFAVTATLGHLGAGLRWCDRPVPWLTRLAVVSFWVYLIHHPLLGFLQIVARPLPLPAVLKFLLVLTVTTAGCLLTYRHLVEGRTLGRLLDGESPWKILRDRPDETAPEPVREPSKFRPAA